MRLIAVIIMLVTISSSVIPCHAGEHEHGSIDCHEHHQNHDHNSDSSDDDHPCSPFCMHHASFFVVVSSDNMFTKVMCNDICFAYLLRYASPQSESHIIDQWHPPKVLVR